MRRVGQTSIINVSVEAKDANEAASIANAIVATYFREQITSQSTKYQEESDWLQLRLAGLRKQAEVAERAVQDSRTQGDFAGMHDLESAASANRASYDLFLRKYIYAEQMTSYTPIQSRLIEAASAPLIKSSPHSLFILVTSIIFGSSASTLLVLMMESNAPQVCDEDSVVGALGIQSLGGLTNAIGEGNASYLSDRFVPRGSFYFH